MTARVAVLVSWCVLAACGVEPSDGVNTEKVARVKRSIQAWTCPQSGTPWFDDFEMSTDKWLPKKMADIANYANHSWLHWQMLFNQNVEGVSFRFTDFEVERNYDYFNIDGPSGTEHSQV
jgi:hypothetical protein